MRKPISKHALRRAMERVHAEGLLQWSEPVGAVVDRVWHEVEKEAYDGAKKKPAVPRGAARKKSAAPVAAGVGGGSEPLPEG